MSSTVKTRLLCRVVRIRIALSGSAGKTTGHAANCPDCQAYYRASDSLENALRQSSAQEKQAAADDLAAKIALAVRRSAPRPRRSRATILSTLAGATMIVALSFFVVRQNWSIQPIGPRNQPNADIRPADVADVMASVAALRIRFMDTVKPAATTLAAQNPLTQELHSVQADARSALGFIALNFLPADSARSLESRTDSTRS